MLCKEIEAIEPWCSNNQLSKFWKGISLHLSFDFITVTTIISIGLMVWACIEVGSNDAANLINAVFGARVMRRKTAVLLAGAFVVLGATFAIRSWIPFVRVSLMFLALMQSVISVFIASYLVNTVCSLLFGLWFTGVHE